MNLRAQTQHNVTLPAIVRPDAFWEGISKNPVTQNPNKKWQLENQHSKNYWYQALQSPYLHGIWGIALPHGGHNEDHIPFAWQATLHKQVESAGHVHKTSDRRVLGWVFLGFPAYRIEAIHERTSTAGQPPRSASRPTRSAASMALPVCDA